MDSSPTGAPLIPQIYVRWISLITGTAGATAVALHEQLGHGTIAEKVLAGIAAVGLYVVANSQGIRRQPAE